MIGERLGEFEILELVRKSSFGNTYRARQHSQNRNVAVRVLKPGALTKASLERFLADTERLIALRHPNVVQIYSLGHHQGAPFVAMELLSGRPLSEMGRELGLSTQTRLTIAIQVARGLGAIHAEGIVHRGLSPASVMVADRTVKISDLGLSGSLGQITYNSEERLGDTTADYLSPEQIQGGEITPASDVFAFGVMLYEIVSGVHPFHAEHPMALLNNVIHQPPAPLAKRATGDWGGQLPKLERLVMACLEKIPSRRPRSMVGMAEALTDIERGLKVAESSHGIRSAPAKLPNPYGKKVMIRAREGFFGRRQEVERIYARLNADPPESVAMVGDRKIGKSSLLNFIYMRTNREAHLRSPDTMVMVFLDLQQETAWTMELFARVLLETIELETESRLRVADCSRDLQGIRSAVDRLHKEGYRLTIILDEFERITANAQFPLEFFVFLRSLAQHYNVAYLTSSARDLPALCHDKSISDSPFFNIFSLLRLGPFPLEEAQELIRIPSERAGHPLDPYADAIVDLAGTSPFFLQIACFWAFESLADGAVPDLTVLRQRFDQEAGPHFQAGWDGCDEAERSVLKNLAEGRTISEPLQHVLEELTTRGLVKPDRQRLCSSSFGDFVLRRKGVEAPPRSGPGWPRRKRTRVLVGAGGLGLLGIALAVAFYFVPRAGPDVGVSRQGVGPSEDRGRPVTPSTPAVILPSYAHSYALVIGAGKYERGWPALPNVASDVQEVVAVLEDHGFQVEKVADPDEAHLRGAFQDFINRHGLDEKDRLLFYFAGHGHTVHQSYGEEMGYIVPTDAPDPAKDLSGFMAKAISMDQIATYARAIQSRHALFVFDACFAGSIFTQSRSSPGHIAFKMESPVRQFITSGDANETVPDRSMFRREFVAGLRGEADQNGDHYITGSELGEFLLEKVAEYTKDAQHPRQGKLRDPNLDKGDFVFFLPIHEKQN